mmetsp:Transcript_11910/g.25122  ORF Transcript_11910/g.25122 Transcript_11910/m.25122 type:complete len:259 (-) Transcript_11910:270-1046(-)
MFSSIFPTIYSFLPNYSSSDIERSVANLNPRDRAALTHEVASGMRTVSSSSSRSHISSPATAATSTGLVTVIEEGDQLAPSQERSEIVGESSNNRINNEGDEFDNERDELDLDELNTTLEQCKISLKSFETKERFLWTRISRYRQLMKKREQYIFDLQSKCAASSIENSNAISDDYDEENRNGDNDRYDDLRKQVASLQEKHGHDRENLSSVEQIYKEILIELETLRRKIHDLEEKRTFISQKREECQEFLIAAAEMC